MRITRQFLTTSAIVAALSVAGCKKDEPAPTPEPAAADVAVAEKAPTPELPVEPAVTPKPVEGTPVEPVAAVAGDFLERAPLSMKSLTTMPEKILGVAATSSLKGLVESFAGFAPGVPADPFGVLLTVAQRGAGLGDLTKIAWEKPLYVVFPSPVVWKDGFVWVATINEGFDVKATFPSAIEADNGFKLTLEGQKLFVRTVDSSLHVASHADLLVEFNTFLSEDLLAWVPSSPLQMDASVANAMKVYANEIAEAKQMLPMLAGQLKEAGGNAAQVEMMTKYSEEALAMIEGISHIGFAMDPAKAFPRLGFSMRFKEGSSGAAFVADTAERRAKLATSIPADAWLSFAGSWDNQRDATTAEELAAMLVSAYADLMPITPAVALDFAERAVKLNTLTGDQQSLWFRTAGDIPVALESLSTVTDAGAWRETLVGIIDLVLEHAWAHAKVEMLAKLGPKGAEFDTDHKTAWGKVGVLMAPMGISLSDRSDDALLGGEVKIDWSKIPVQDKREVEMFQRFLGANVQFGIGSKDGYAAAAFGPTGYARVEALLSQEAPKSTEPRLNRAAERSWGVMAINPAPLLKVISTWPDLADAAPFMRAIPALPVTVEGIANAEMLQFELEVPGALIKAIAAFFTIKE